MGGYFSSNASSSSLSHAELYAELEKTRIERQLAVEQLLEHRRRAYKIAEEREKLKWSASGGGVMMVFCLFSWFHHKQKKGVGQLPLPGLVHLCFLGFSLHQRFGKSNKDVGRA
ncbi:hypothetical protein Y032_0384g399 [Ancylostoma ceylanicum]|uniref:Uncharacterized protein n=1 Tax=Ancylostoma ceylanicum TaxID=53326 RepID=A0A016RSV1_9BILA|nr:hypothetical protein Y032_0384g399 [Ancylostoma ceylanicum]